MTTEHELLAKIKQAQKHYCEIYVGGNNDCSTEGTEPCYSCQLHSALRAVVEREEKVTKTMTSTMEALKNSGYNQCLADIKADIEKELG